MATIKAIEGRSVHQIQSGQVIVDLCSVVKELVENSIDAGATSIDVRFKNYGADSIEVQDNGSGVAPEDFETIALKHYTSKISSYDDLEALHTFGFRGEALSSLCALSKFHIVTARASDGPKGTRLDFETSGKLKGTSVVATTKGTTVTIEDIFYNLPVRKRELVKNLKREYGKVLGLLHAYACISTGVRFAVSNQIPKGKKTVAFSTKINSTTKENIANVYGAKTLSALIPLDLKLEMQPTVAPGKRAQGTDINPSEVQIVGHISRPVVGEGRQTPDRQMFFVNSRPCILPQVVKAFNEVYKSYNVTQSPFIFANLKMDTNAYDVNVSPDKRTILLHEQTALLESLKTSLVELFEAHDQSVPQGQLLPTKKITAFQPLTINRDTQRTLSRENSRKDDTDEERQKSRGVSVPSSKPGVKSPTPPDENFSGLARDQESQDPVAKEAGASKPLFVQDDESGESDDADSSQPPPSVSVPRPVQDFNDRIHDEETIRARETPSKGARSQPESSFISGSELLKIPTIQQSSQKGPPSVIQNAFDRMRPKRMPAETATITVGNKTTVSTVGSHPHKRRRVHIPKIDEDDPKAGFSSPLFGKLRGFVAPGTQLDKSDSIESSGSDNEEEGQPSEDDEGDEIEEMPASVGPARNSQETSDEEMDDVREPGEAVQETLQRPEESKDVVEHPVEAGSDDDYIDEAEKKAKEDEKVAQMIAEAEEAAARPTEDNVKRANKALRGPTKRYTTLQLEKTIDTSALDFKGLVSQLNAVKRDSKGLGSQAVLDEDPSSTSEEERLSLTVSKADFGKMRIAGQFNLGFILAVRPDSDGGPSDQLFIIDQHASDEKYNFERLQKSTILTPQRLVHPHPLSLTAIEEEVIMNHRDALTANGFFVDVDTSGDEPVGNRCSLLTLPTSREVTFTPADLEELLVLLSEHVGSGIPRPAKVRKLLAMRACRGSVMIGKTLTPNMMEKIVRHLGEMDKPWNCPHGRPTMRHLYGLEAWKSWSEGDGVVGLGESKKSSGWGSYLRAKKGR